MAAQVVKHEQTAPAPAPAPASPHTPAKAAEAPPLNASNAASASPSELSAHEVKDLSANKTPLANDKANVMLTDKPIDAPVDAPINAPVDAPVDPSDVAGVDVQVHQQGGDTDDHADNKPTIALPVVPLPLNGVPSSDKGDKQEECAPSPQGEEVDATMNGPVAGEKRKAGDDPAGPQRDESPAKKVKTDTKETAEAPEAAGPPEVNAQVPAANGGSKKRPGRPSKRDQAKTQKKMPAPVGRTVRKTRSQGPVA